MVVKQIEQLVDHKLSGINTVALGIVTEVKANMRCNVKLKNKYEGYEIELFDVPITALSYGGNSVLIQPALGDVVLLLFSKYELEEQLKSKSTVAVNEVVKFSVNNALVLTGVFTAVDTVPSELEANTILIKHSTGNYFKFLTGGSVTLKGDLYINGALTYDTMPLFDANTILIANADNTPVALSVPASTILGRADSGGIAALSGASAKGVIGLSNVTNDAQLKRAAGDFNTFAEKEVPLGADILLMEDSASGYAKKKVQIGNITGWGGEANTASNVGTAGVGIFKQKTGIDLEFKKINAGSVKVTITDDTENSEVDIDVVEAQINHNALLNYAANQHVVLPATIAAVLTDHDKAAHDALAIDHNQLTNTHNLTTDIDHNQLTNYAANQHVVLPATIAAVLTDHDKAAHDALGIAPAEHGVDKHTNVTRELYIPLSGVYTAASPVKSGDATALPPGIERTIVKTYKVPDKFVSGGTFKFTFYVPANADNTKNMVWSTQVSWGAAGETHDSTNNSDASNVEGIPDTNKKLKTVTTENTFTGLAKGDFLSFAITRNGDSENDTFEDTVHAVGITFEYTGEQ